MQKEQTIPNIQKKVITLIRFEPSNHTSTKHNTTLHTIRHAVQIMQLYINNPQTNHAA